MVFRLVSAEVKDLTLELAQYFKGLEASPTERPRNELRIKQLKDKAKAGKLITFHWATAKYGGKVLRINGQHSSNMLCELDGGFPSGLKVHLDTYEVDKDEDMAGLFQQFDWRQGGRSSGDVSHAYQGLYEPLRSVPNDAAKLAIDGLSWYRRNVEGVPVPPGDDVYSLFRETGLHEYIRWIGSLFSLKTNELKRPQIVAAMYATFNVNHGDARKFWDTVARGGVQYEDNAAETVLDNWLKELLEETKRKNGKAKQLKPAHYYQGCVYAWNAHREGRTLKEIKYEHKHTLIVVE